MDQCALQWHRKRNTSVAHESALPTRPSKEQPFKKEGHFSRIYCTRLFYSKKKRIIKIRVSDLYISLSLRDVLHDSLIAIWFLLIRFSWVPTSTSLAARLRSLSRHLSDDDECLTFVRKKGTNFKRKPKWAIVVHQPVCLLTSLCMCTSINRCNNT